MLSSSQIKFIRSLAQKKERDLSGLFVAEGEKTISELINYFPCRLLVCSNEQLKNRSYPAKETIQASTKELERASFQKTPQGMIAVFEKPSRIFSSKNIEKGLYLALDGVQNPGNLGTIIRLADWFGIRQLFCSPDTADAFGPKTVQATMGALGRVEVYYVDLVQFLEQISPSTPIFGTFLGGSSIYTESLPKDAIVVMGSEGTGISEPVASQITRRLEIPSYPPNVSTSESLNVAVATAIVCSEFRRNAITLMK